MAKRIKCHHCGQLVRENRRLKGCQRYCGSAACQRARRNLWERKKLRTDSEYRERRKSAKEKWRKSKPLHAYQRDYRAKHQEYVENSRSAQQGRNQRRKGSVSMHQIVKTDALNSVLLVSTGFYALYPCENASGKNIVKTDALIVQLAGIQRDAGVLLHNTT